MLADLITFLQSTAGARRTKFPMGHLMVSGILLYAAAVLQDADAEIVIE